MKEILSCKRTAIILLAVTILTLGFYVYMIARPISYGMEYHTKTEYEGMVFENTVVHYPDTTVIYRSSTFIGDQTARYYYKDGYTFAVAAQTDPAYEKEVAEIEADFEKAVKTPFYAQKVNAFRLTAENEGYTIEYKCDAAVRFAIIFGVVEALLIALTAVSLVLYKKSK